MFVDDGVISAADPVREGFLDFLARDMARNPERLRAVDADLVQGFRSLVAEVVLELDAPLSADDE